VSDGNGSDGGTPAALTDELRQQSHVLRVWQEEWAIRGLQRHPELARASGEAALESMTLLIDSLTGARDRLAGELREFR
jgi:hypothetical protein